MVQVGSQRMARRLNEFKSGESHSVEKVCQEETQIFKETKLVDKQYVGICITTKERKFCSCSTYFSTTKSKIVDEHKFSTYKSTPSDFYDYDFLFGPICSVVSYHPNRNFATFSFFSLPGLPRPQIVINFVRMVQYRPISLLVRDPTIWGPYLRISRILN